MKLKKEDKDRKLLWCPFAKKAPNVELHTKGVYPQGYPEGAIIHYTAGRSLKGDSDAVNTLANAKLYRHCYFCISSTGTIFQNFPLNRWGNHAGRSSHPFLGESLSSRLVGIEVCCAGKLYRKEDNYFYSWFEEAYSEYQVRLFNGDYYHKFTEKQEYSLLKLLMWLKWNNTEVFDFKLVLGHEEVSLHKSDPGGSISMAKHKYRKYIDDFFLELSCEGPVIPFSYEEEFGASEFQTFLNNVFGFDLEVDGIPGYETSTAFHSVFGDYLQGDPRHNIAESI